MAGIRFILGFLCPLALVAAVFLMADGIKGDPQDLSQALEGGLLFGVGLLCLPQPGHPIHRLIERMSSKTPARDQAQTPKAPVSPEVGRHLQDMLDYNLKALTFKPRPRPWHAGWCRLDPVIGASVDATSWIGGLPEMPEDIAWPEHDGRPMVFVAQIAMKDLPPNVWDGLGPNGGWLLFFFEPRAYRIVRVLHVHRNGPVRPLPDMPEPEYRISLEMRNTLEALGRDAERSTLMKWALKTTPLGPTAPEPPSWDDRYKIKQDLRKALWNTDVSVEPFRPNRPELMQALLGALDFQLQKSRSSYLKPKLGTEKGDALAVRYETAQAQLADLRIRAAGGLTSEDLIAEADRIADGGANAENDLKPLPQAHAWIALYRRAVEHLAREKLLNDPSKLTAAEREVFEPVWHFDATYEAATISGAVSPGYTYTVVEEPVLLLQFPTSQLTGWSQSDGVPFGFFINPKDLKAGRWENAWGDIVN